MTDDSILQFSDPDTREAVARYRARFAQHACTPETLGWRPATQDVRFAAFWRGFTLCPPASVLDIGCGFGDLLAFLRTRGWVGSYHGIDIVPEFLTAARQKYVSDSSATFDCLDFLDGGQGLKADAVLASGLLNHRRTDHISYVTRFIATAAEAATHYMAIDFLSDTADRRRDDLFFHSPGEILAIGLSHSKRAQIDHTYMPYEFMLKLWFPDTTPPDFPVFSEIP